MKKIIILLVTLVATSAMAKTENYLYISYSSLSLNKNLLFKVKVSEAASCALSVTNSRDTENNMAYVASLLQEDDVNILSITNFNLSIDDPAGIGSTDYSPATDQTTSQLFTSLGFDYGFDSHSVTAGSLEKVLFILNWEYVEEGTPAITEADALDVTSTVYSKLLSEEGHRNQVTLNVECESGSME